MSVILYNTVHELISKVNKLELNKVLKQRYGRGIYGTCVEPVDTLTKISSVNYDSSNRIMFCIN